jgi:hypothetical protein
MNWLDEFKQLMFPIDPKEMEIEKAFLLKQQNLPSVIYRYRVVNKYSLKDLQKDTIWVSTPRNFNDPYDCSHYADYSNLSRKLFKKNMDTLPYIDVIKNRIGAQMFEDIQTSDDPYTALMSHIDELFAKEHPDKAEEFKSFSKKIEKKSFDDLIAFSSELIKDSFRVCSFTTCKDSILMWSHYANFHRGFCVAYDITEYPYGDYRSRFLYPIIYSDKMADTTELMEFSIDNENFNNLYYSLSALVKSKEWSYEKEWRIVFANGIFREDRSYPMNKPKAIYLGTKISAEHQKMLVDIAIKKGIDIYKMQMDPNLFRIFTCDIADADKNIFLKKE